MKKLAPMGWDSQALIRLEKYVRVNPWVLFYKGFLSGSHTFLGYLL
jgi:hypothetical protein